MRNKKIILSFFIILCGCVSVPESDARSKLENWTLIKTHRAEKGEPLYARFGPVTYDIYTNPVLSNYNDHSLPLPLHSEIAIRVYAGEKDSGQIAFTGFLVKTGNTSADARWKMAAYDINNRALPEEQLVKNCQGCHQATDDKIILGTY